MTQARLQNGFSIPVGFMHGRRSIICYIITVMADGDRKTHSIFMSEASTTLHIVTYSC